jgi:hypothetical protein
VKPQFPANRRFPTMELLEGMPLNVRIAGRSFPAEQIGQDRLSFSDPRYTDLVHKIDFPQ